jgi:hypothetical protein
MVRDAVQERLGSNYLIDCVEIVEIRFDRVLHVIASAAAPQQLLLSPLLLLLLPAASAAHFCAAAC